MHTHDIPSITLATAAFVTLGLWVAPPTLAFQAAPATAAVASEALEEHLDEADDLLETLLGWHRAITATNVGAESHTPPTAPMPVNTLIPLSRQEVEKLIRFVDAVSAMVAAPPAAPAARGDMRDHARQAHAIAAELLPASDRPVGTSGSTANIVMVDRAALQRLEIEVEAMETLARAARERQ